jgi:uncharacterized repeat protein (TIGR01451 family)
MSHLNTKQSRRRAFTTNSIARLILLVLLTGFLLSSFPSTLFAVTNADLTFTLLSGDNAAKNQKFVVDSVLSQCNAGTGPQATYVGYRITNTAGGTGTLTNLTATLGGFDAGFGLAGGQPAMLQIGTLADGASVELYWYVSYPCTRPVTDTLTLTVADATANTATETFSVTTTSMQSANAGGSVVTAILGPGAVVGQIFSSDVTYDFGNVPSSGEVLFQPSGETTYDAACFQLTGSQVISSTLNAVPVAASSDDLLYFVSPSQDNTQPNVVTIRYFYLYKCAGVSTQAVPYAAATSGGSLKYTGNYDTFCLAAPAGSSCTPPAATNPFTISKSASPTILPTGGTVTYTVTIQNTSAFDSRVDRIEDVLPTGVTYGALVNGATCGSNAPSETEVTAVNSSVIPTAGATGTLVWRGLSAPGDAYAIPSGGNLVVCYSATIPNVPGTYGNSVTATTGTATTGPATSTVSVGTPDIIIDKAHAVDPFVRGAVGTYTLLVSNIGTAPTSGGVTVTDALPAGLTLSATPTGSGWICSGVAGDGSFTCTRSDALSATGAYPAITVSVNVLQSAANSVTNTATVTGGGDATPDNDDDLTNITSLSDLSLTKTVNNPTPTIGTNVTFTLTVSNAGPSNATSVTVQDQLPAGYTFVSSNASQGSYDSGTGVWTVGAVNATGSATLDIVATVNATGPYGNTAQVSAADQPDPDSTPGNSVTTEDDQATNTPVPVVAPSADLSLTKTVNNPTPTIGTNVTFTLTVSNAGPSNATGISVQDQLPAGYTFVSSNASQGSYDSGTGVWTVGAVNATGSATLQIIVTINTAGAITNSAQVSASDQPDPDSIVNNGTGNAEDDRASVTTPQGTSDLSMTKTASSTTPTIGGTVTFTLTVNNAGPDAATNVIVQDQLPAGYTFVSSNASQGSYDSGTGVWTVGAVNATGSAALDIVATVNATGPYGNTAQVLASDQFDPDSTPNNGASEDDQSAVSVVPAVPGVIPPPAATSQPTPVVIIEDPFITKNVNPPFVQPGELVTWTIIVTNPGTLPATNITVNDNMPNEVEVLTVSATAGTISFSGQAVSFNIATLVGGQSVTITINTRVRSSVASPFTIINTASVTNAENPTARSTQASLFSPTSLPQTGETPWWRLPLLAVISAALGIVIWGGYQLAMRTRRYT